MSEQEQTDEDFTTDVDDSATEVAETDATGDTDALPDEGTEIEGQKSQESRVTQEQKEKSPESSATRVERKAKKKKPKTWMEKCTKKKWTCDEMSPWRVFMNTFLEDQEQLKKDDIFKQRRPANIRKFPRVQSEKDLGTHHRCLPLHALQLQNELALPNKLDRTKMIRIWRNMRANLPVHSSKSDIEVAPNASKAVREKWPGVWPCTTRDLVNEIRERRMEKLRKRRDLYPCDPEEHDREAFEDPEKDFSECKELGHARIPQPCPTLTKELLVDKAAGPQPGLVDGDYIIFELPSKARGNRVYADVVLRGLKGMHLPELGVLRTRQNTWKFCFYQAVIALLAKTQLRYKYAWSANIDYIYDHAWMLYTHIGAINIQEKQRLDDIVVYNYKYSIEVKLVRECNDVPILEDVPWDYEEKNLKRKMILERKELMNVRLEIGSEKITDRQTASVHNGIKKIEEMFDEIPVRYSNCIFRTTRFSVAYWKDNLFWYLYNPYRCDEFGYWDDTGYACIIKFCTKASLKRHLMILLLRAYVHTLPKSDMQKAKEEAAKAAEKEAPAEDAKVAEEEKAPAEDGQAAEADAPAEDAQAAEADAPAEDAQAAEADAPEEDAAAEAAKAAEAAETAEAAEAAEAENAPEEEKQAEAEDAPKEEESAKAEDAPEEEEPVEEEPTEKFFTVQIFHITHLCCQVHNLKLLQRGGPKPSKRFVKRKTIDDCPFDPFDSRDPCTIEQEESDLKDAIEKPTWLKLYKIIWGKCTTIPTKKKSTKDTSGTGKMRWHQYVVEESNKLFSLWGELHITDGMFERENRGMQTYACYVVCAGMTRIMAPEYWSTKTLDVIVMCGDRYYTHSKLEAEFKSTKNEYSHVNCWNRYLMSHFKIGETMFEAKVLPAICGRLYSKTNRYLWQSLEQMFLRYHFGILTCESSCLGVFKFCGAYYMCDVNSFGPPLFEYGEGTVYMMRATYLYKFITVLVLTIGSPECSQFALNPIEILKVMDVGPSVLPFGRFEKKDRSRRTKKVDCPYDEQKKKQMKRWKHKRQETARTIDKMCCKGA